MDSAPRQTHQTRRPRSSRAPGRVDLVGVLGGEVFGANARRAVLDATVVAGTSKHLDTMALPQDARRLPLEGDLRRFVASFAEAASSGESVCVLCSGDPGFFGLARLASLHISPSLLRIHPAPSSVSLAFARAGTNWDDAEVVSAHGRPGGAAEAARAIERSTKVAVLCGPDSPPQLLGRLALEYGARDRRIWVGSGLGSQAESVWTGNLEALAAGRFDPASVVVSIVDETRQTIPGPATLRWGRPESEFEHIRGMVTKAEVRAIAISKLDLPVSGVMWDVGAGSGSVSVECASLSAGLGVHAIERDPDQLKVLRSNTANTRVRVCEGEAPGVFESLEDPDRVFVGGGGIGVLDAALARLRPAGLIVAVYATPERALAAAERLGAMVQVSINRAVPFGHDAALRLQAENPVFVCWGPSANTVSSK